jgi:hypothetical protein
MNKGPSIGSPLLFVCGAAHVKSIRQMNKGSSIGSPLLFVCGIALVKSVRQMNKGPSIRIPLLFIRVGLLTIRAIKTEPLVSIRNPYC